MNNGAEPPGSLGEFTTTRWTLVMSSRGQGTEARAALGALCEAYWQPVFRFLVREGRSQEEAREITQDFFARILAGSAFQSVEPGKSRFRSYLLGALKHYLAAQRQKEHRLKRGAGVLPETLALEGEEEEETSPALLVADSTQIPDTYFDREWALAVMDRGLRALQHECILASKAQEFEILKPWLAGEITSMTQAEAASRLGLTEGAVKVSIHRLRKRFRELVRQDLAETVATKAEVDEELRYLVEALACFLPFSNQRLH